jgi:hypothetical protein
VLRKLLVEPLVHFVLLGLVLFALNAVLAPTRSESSNRIVVTAAFRDELARGYTQANGRAPTPVELDDLVARWIDDEVLYREGLKRGLERDDALVRQRVAAKMGFVLESKVVLVEPSEGELQHWFEQHAERWQKSELVDFIHVFVEGTDESAKTRANEILGRLEDGADPNGLGDRFSGGRHYRARKIEDLKKSFGEEFVEGMSEQPIGIWQLRRSRFGFHLVRVERRTAGGGVDFQSVRLEVEKDWKDARRASEVAKAREELKRHFRIEQPR